MKEIYFIGSMLLAACIFAGCGEKEAEIKNQITIASYDAANTASEYVKRGDLHTGETILLTLEASDTQAYSFGQSDLLIEKVYTAEGELVTKGTLLAEADNEAIKRNLSKTRTEVLSITENIVHYTSLLEAVNEKNADKPEEEKAYKDEISRYELKLAELNDKLAVAKREETELNEKLSKTQIYAEMDGCVEYVGEYGNGITSDERMPFIKLGTKDRVFMGSIKGPQTLSKGDKLTITIGEGTYSAVILSAESLEEETIIRVMTDEYVDLTEVTYAELLWNEEHLTDVLYVPTDAVLPIKGEYYVYVYDEKGFPNPVKVDIGKMGSKYTSIVNGVAEGDLVEIF